LSHLVDLAFLLHNDSAQSVDVEAEASVEPVSGWQPDYGLTPSVTQGQVAASVSEDVGDQPGGNTQVIPGI
jgi:hypothetical protein